MSDFEFNPYRLTAEQKRRRAKRRRMYRLRQRLIEIGILAVLAAVIIVPICLLTGNKKPTADPVESTPTVSTPAEKPKVPSYPTADENTVALGGEVDAPYAVLVDVTTGRIVAQKNADEKAFPASITKVMTLLVAAEQTTDYDATYTMSYEFLNDLYLQEATVAGFSSGEQVTVNDMLYGCILPSGADATIGLSNHLAGSETDFAGLMNQKVGQLGLKNTHFVNSSGLHHNNHYTTATDMAVIMMAAMQNPKCKEVLSTYQYTTRSTEQHPNGLLLTSTLFSRMKGDEPEGATVIAGKTGYTGQAKHTMVSYATGDNGHDYVFVTMGGTTRWKATFDAIDTLTAFLGDTQTKTE